jgi:uncharacterized membrane protein (DUF2068 family)
VILDAKVGRAKYYADPMNERAAKERPALITLISILGFLGAVSGLWGLRSPYNQALGTTFQVYYAAALLLILIAFVGLWKMKKWGAVLYIVVALINVGVTSQVLHFKAITLLISIALNAAIIAVLIYNFSKMD